MTVSDPSVVVDLRGLLAKMEHHRDSAVQALDSSLEAIRSVHLLDRHLVACGIHAEEQLDHSVCGCDNVKTNTNPWVPLFPGASVAASGCSSPVDLGDALATAAEASEIPLVLPDPPPPVAARAPKSEKTPPQSLRKRFTDEEKAAAVHLADQLGSNAAAARQVGTTAQSITNWRNEGRGKATSASSMSTPTAASSAPPKATQNRYTDEQKDAAVDLAIQLGSDKAAGQQLGIGQSQVSEWHRKGFGTVPEAKGSPAAEAKASGPAGPTMHCPECKASLPIDGVPDSSARALTLRAHYKASPTCEEAIRTKVGVALWAP